MSPRSPARLLAPLALVVVAAALFVVVTRGSDTEREATPRAVETAPEAKSKAKPKAKPKASRRYTVKPGDTLSGIAEQAGIPVEELLDLNPKVDPQSLNPGTKLRLR